MFLCVFSLYTFSYDLVPTLLAKSNVRLSSMTSFRVSTLNFFSLPRDAFFFNPFVKVFLPNPTLHANSDFSSLFS